MIYDVRHLTTVDYSSPVRLARFNVRLVPAPWRGQLLHSHELIVTPRPAFITSEYGPYLVNRSRLTLREPTESLIVESRFTVEVEEPSFLLDSIASPALWQVRADALAHHDLSAFGPSAYLYASTIARPSAAITEWARPFLTGDISVVEAGRALMSAIHSLFRYDSKATRTDTPPEEAFLKRRGVCQDFSHVMIVAARAWGIPAAYVSGYLRTLPPPGKPRLVGADAMHAWVNLWCGDQLGWVGFDPTNNILADSSHIFTAMGRDYADIAPLDGVFHGGGGQSMDVAVDVMPRALDGLAATG